MFELLPCIFAVGHWKYSLCVWIYSHVYLSWYGRHSLSSSCDSERMCISAGFVNHQQNDMMENWNVIIFLLPNNVRWSAMRKSLENMAILQAQSINLEIIKINCLPSNEIIRKFPRIFRHCLAWPPHQRESATIISSIKNIGKRRHSRTVNEVKLRQNWKAQLVGRGVDS